MNPYVQRLDLPLYLLWGNGIIFAGGIGGFAFVHSLMQGEVHKDIWTFAGTFLAGLLAFAALLTHLYARYRKAQAVLHIDETTVTISAPGHSFNFGMLDHILWDQDYAKNENSRISPRKLRTKMIVSYRMGTHFKEGIARTFVFEAHTSPVQLAELQGWYRRLMLVLKTRRKLQRDLTPRVQSCQAVNDHEGMGKLIERVRTPAPDNMAAVTTSTHPDDVIYMLYSDLPRRNLGPVESAVMSVVNSKPLSVVATGWLADVHRHPVHPDEPCVSFCAFLTHTPIESAKQKGRSPGPPFLLSRNYSLEICATRAGF